MSPNTTITEMASQQRKKEQKEVTLTELQQSFNNLAKNQKEHTKP